MPDPSTAIIPSWVEFKMISISCWVIGAMGRGYPEDEIAIFLEKNYMNI